LGRHALELSFYLGLDQLSDEFVQEKGGFDRKDAFYASLTPFFYFSQTSGLQAVIAVGEAEVGEELEVQPLPFLKLINLTFVEFFVKSSFRGHFLEFSLHFLSGFVNWGH